jgi:hypothetical protein
MKKSILIIVILSIAALCFAGPLQEMHKRVIAGSTVAGGGAECSTTDEYNASTSFQAADYGGASSSVYYAFKIQAINSNTPCEVDIEAQRYNSPTYDAYISLYTNDENGDGPDTTNDEPDSIVGSESSASDTTSWPASYDTVTFSWASGAPSKTGSTYYWWVVRFDTAGGGANLVQIHVAQSPTGGGGGVTQIMTSSDGSTWSSASTVECANFEVRS